MTLAFFAICLVWSVVVNQFFLFCDIDVYSKKDSPQILRGLSLQRYPRHWIVPIARQGDAEWVQSVWGACLTPNISICVPDTQHQRLRAWHPTSASPPQSFLRFPNKAMWSRCVFNAPHQHHPVHFGVFLNFWLFSYKTWTMWNID